MAPAVVIRIELEAPPRVVVDALHEGEYDRLGDWLRSHPDLLDLIRRARDLEQREQAA